MTILTTVSTQAEEASFDSEGVQIRYLERGAGRPVVLIHGITCCVENNWLETGIFEALGRDFRVVAFDCRGHGESDKPVGPEHYGMEMAHDIIRLMDHLRIETADLVGYSMGGRIAAKLAAVHPERVRSLTLIGAGEAVDGELFSALARSLESGGGIEPLVRAIWPVGQPPPTAAQLAEINEERLSGASRMALASVAKAYEEWNLTGDELRSSGIPALAIVGSADPVVAAVNALQQRMPRLRVLVVPGADHVTILQRREPLETVRAFLQGRLQHL